MLALHNCLMLLYMICLRLICYCFIQVWDLNTFECKMTLNAHIDTVTSLICWKSVLLSGSSDCTIKAWFQTEEGNLEVIHSHNVENVSYLACVYNISA
jgi:WD40 repeat protein